MSRPTRTRNADDQAGLLWVASRSSSQARFTSQPARPPSNAIGIWQHGPQEDRGNNLSASHPRWYGSRPKICCQPSLRMQVDRDLLTQFRLGELDVGPDLIRGKVACGDFPQQRIGPRNCASDRPLHRYVPDGRHDPFDHQGETPGCFDEPGLSGPCGSQHPCLPARCVLIPDRHGTRATALTGRHRQSRDVRLGQEGFAIAYRQADHMPSIDRGTDNLA